MGAMRHAVTYYFITVVGVESSWMGKNVSYHLNVRYIEPLEKQ